MRSEPLTLPGACLRLARTEPDDAVDRPTAPLRGELWGLNKKTYAFSFSWENISLIVVLISVPKS